MSTDFVADLGLNQEEMEQCKHAYRMIGKRDYGIDFDPALVPAAVQAILVNGLIEYLHESEGSKDEIATYTRLLDRLWELEAAA